jgi:hypothetical protein
MPCMLLLELSILERKVCFKAASQWLSTKVTFETLANSVVAFCVIRHQTVLLHADPSNCLASEGPVVRYSLHTMIPEQ